MCKWMNGWSIDTLHRAPQVYVNQIAEMMTEEADTLQWDNDGRK
jgi:hypothetical protein